MKTFLRMIMLALVCIYIGSIGCDPNSSSGENANSDGGNKEDNSVACTKDADCGAAQYCNDKLCKDKCKDDKSCGKDQKCNKNDGKCHKACSFDTQCPSDQACDPQKGHCIPVKKCEKIEDCAKKCSSDKDCDAPQTCGASKYCTCPKDAKDCLALTCNTCRKVCTPWVGEICQEDFNCPGGADEKFCDKCIGQCRDRLTLCQPCQNHGQCGGENDLCLPDILNPQSGNKFCSAACQNNAFCKAKYKCKQFKNAKDPELQKSPYQCIPASNNCASPGECKSNEDCREQGKICNAQSGQCIAGCEVDENCPVRSSGKCETKDDCKNSKAVCDAKLCSVQLKCCRGKCGTPCNSDSECEAQEKCEGGCCKVEGECTTSKDCKEPQTYCDQQTGLCTPGCETPDDCGQPDPQKLRCRWKCRSNKCEEDCTCRDPNLDCPSVRFCPFPEDEKKDPLAPCRKPIGPLCQSCSAHADCGCKKGDDCKYTCVRKQCASDDDCKDVAGGSNSCYNGLCSTKKACKTDGDCPSHERCANNFCSNNCFNICLQLMTGNRCFTGCDPTGDGKECPSRLSCIELLPSSGSGSKCKGGGKRCKTDKDCSGTQNRCGEDAYCTQCQKGKVCRNLDPRDPLNLICLDMPPTVCTSTGGDVCGDAGF